MRECSTQLAAAAPTRAQRSTGRSQPGADRDDDHAAERNGGERAQNAPIEEAPADPGEHDVSPEAANAIDELVKATYERPSHFGLAGMAFRRGFRTEANEITAEVRTELGLSLYDALDPYALAQWLEIPIVGLSEFVEEAPAVAHLLDIEPEVFSAVMLFAGSRRRSPTTTLTRTCARSATCLIELSHALHHHPPTSGARQQGCRHWNQDIEDEATGCAERSASPRPLQCSSRRNGGRHTPLPPGISV